jgi:hypothetical protein
MSREILRVFVTILELQRAYVENKSPTCRNEAKSALECGSWVSWLIVGPQCEDDKAAKHCQNKNVVTGKKQNQCYPTRTVYVFDVVSC